MKNGKLILLGVVALVVGYVAYRSFTSVKGAADKALETARTGVADVLTKLFGPKLSAAAQENVYYVVKFPDGQHAVPSSTVNEQTGQFRYALPGSDDERAYQLYIDAQGKKHAKAL